MARNVLMRARCDVKDCDESLDYEVSQSAFGGPFGFGAGLPEGWKSMKQRRPDAPEGSDSFGDHEYADFCPKHVKVAEEEGIWKEALTL